MQTRLTIVLATHNTGKTTEIRNLLQGLPVDIKNLNDFGPIPPIVEDGASFEENAYKKASLSARYLGLPALADDSGLVVDALDGAPGVYSARYARMGSPVFPEMEPAAGNIRKLLLKLGDNQERSARFRTVIALIIKGEEHQFEGRVEGAITETPSGSDGCGYDPVFRPAGYEQTFAEMDMEEKNRISHRGKAVEALVHFLRGM